MEGRGELGLLAVLACRAVCLPADTGSCVKVLPSPAFPLPGVEDPPAGGQTDRQAHLPTPRYHCQPSSCSTPKLFKDSKAAQPRHSRCSRFPPQPAFTSSAFHSSKRAGETPRPCCPPSSSPALLSAKAGRGTRPHTSVLGFLVRKAPAGGRPSPARNGSVSARADGAHTQDVGRVTAPEDKRAAGHPMAAAWKGAGNSKGAPTQPWAHP